MKKICILLLTLTALGMEAQTTPAAQPVEVTIDATKTNTPISPYLYGQFLEQIGNLIYSSLWSEMLDDRKFYYAVGPKPPADNNPGGGSGFGNRRRGVGPGRWNPIGPVNSVTMDTINPFVGDHTPLITLAGSDPRGIVQTGVNFTQGTAYAGRIELAGDPGANVVINLVWGDDANTVTQTIQLGQLDANYQKFNFSFNASQSGPAKFEIVGTGTGSFHVGVVSLMPTNNVDGFRPDAIAVLRSLHSGVYRIPGGNYVSAFEWRNAIGDPDKRPPVFDPVWRALQPNDIGTDEFMTLCKLLGVEPYITLNAGTGDDWSARDYVEYCNGDPSTPMGQLRAANGHPDPYHVKFWGIGNEMWGISYQFGAMKLNQYEYKHNQFAKAMKKVDPTIKLIASGAMPDTMTGSGESLNLGTNLVPEYLSPEDWTGGMLANCLDNIDLISEHFYNYGATHYNLAQGKQVPNDPNEPVTDWMRRPANHIRIKYEEYLEYEKLLPQFAAHPKPLNIDEWAYSGNNSLYPTYPAYAWVFHEMFRHTDVFQMAAQTFATSLLSRTNGSVSLTANGLVFKIYRDHFGTIPVEVSGNSPQPKPTDPPGGEQPEVNAGSDTFPLDVVAAWATDHHALDVAVLNPTDTNQTLDLNITGANWANNGILSRLASDKGDGKNPVITSSIFFPVPDKLQGLTVPPFSVNIYELNVK
jgi:alpha-N-arabinofuranosidase